MNCEPYPVVADIDFAEGPAFDSRGNLYFVNYIRNGTLGRKTPEGCVGIWVEIPGGQANGLKADAQDRIVVADYGGKRLLRYSPAGEMEVLAAAFQGEPFLGLNDVCLDRAGNIYFSDPTGSSRENPIGAVYRYSTGGELSRLDSGMAFPNGLAVSPEQNRLFVAESGTNRILVYDLTPAGKATNRRVFHQFPNDTVDGIVFDERGRLWVARWTNQTIDVLSPGGELEASIPGGGDQVTNLAFWGKSLYVTVAGRHSIHRFDVGVGAA